MDLSKQSLENLIDLVENKLSCMEVWDREDRREVTILQRCLRELTAMRSGSAPASTAPQATVVAAFDENRRRRGRRPKASMAG
ncbi:MAG: hypothetical protein ACTS3R_17115 [Inquilinaceae bacterium]